MAFKTLATLAALVLVAVVQQPTEVNALSFPSHGSLFSRVPHSELVRRAEEKSKGAKRCPKNRAGKPKPKPEPEEPAKPDPPKPKPKPPPPPPPKVTSVPVKPGGSKTGIIHTGAFPGFLKKAQNAMGHKVWATYNWSPNKNPEATEAGVPFIPMFWGPKSIGEWSKVKRGYATMAFGCNEVNHDDQANISVGEGIRLWRQYLQPLAKQGYSLFSHSFTNAPSGFQWLEDFKNQCKDCWDSTTAVTIHYYSNDPDGMISYLKEAHERFGKPLVVSEFGCANWSGRGAVNDGCSAGEVKAFVEKTTNFMRAQTWILGFFMFGAFPSYDPSGGVPAGNAMFNGNGSFTDVGRAYAY